MAAVKRPTGKIEALDDATEPVPPMVAYLAAADVVVGRTYDVVGAGSKVYPLGMILKRIVTLEGGYETSLVFGERGLTNVHVIRFAQIQSISSIK